jgi:hypothetical protein
MLQDIYVNTRKENKMTKINIKNCVVKNKYRFDTHYHEVADGKDVNLSYMTGTCVTNYKKNDEHLVEIKMDYPIKEFQGEYKNKAIFYFDKNNSQYEDTQVNLIKKVERIVL